MTKATTGRSATENTAAKIEQSNSVAGDTEAKVIPVDSDVDVGHVLDVKGGLKVFRDAKQIRVEKIVHIHGTQQEIQFWDKVTLLRRDVLSKPWVLDRREIRWCRKEAEGRGRKNHHGRIGSNGSNKENGKIAGVEKVEKVAKPIRTGLEKRKTKTKLDRPVQIKGQYGALGI